MSPLKKKPNRFKFRFSLGLLLAALLMAVIPALTLIQVNITREKEYMSDLFKEKGLVLLQSIQAAGGMNRNYEGYLENLKDIVESMENSEDVSFLALTTSDGELISFGGVEFLPMDFFKEEIKVYKNSSLDSSEYCTIPNHGHQSKGILMSQCGHKSTNFKAHTFSSTEVLNLLNGEKSLGTFIVGLKLKPWGNMQRRHMETMGSHNRRDSEMSFQESQKAAEPQADLFLWVGFNNYSFAKIVSANIKGAIFLISFALLVLVAGLTALYWIHSYRFSKLLYQEANALASGLIPKLPLGLIMTNPEGAVTVFNPAVTAISGLKPENVLGLQVDKILAFGNQLPVIPEVGEIEFKIHFKNGNQALLALSQATILNTQGEFDGQTILMRDLGEIGELKLKLAQAEKLASLGRVAAGIAHELRNPLGAIKGLAVYFQEKFAPDSQEAEVAKVMLNSVERLNLTVSEFLDYVKPTKTCLKKTEIKNLLHKSVDFIGHDLQSQNVKIKLNLPKYSVYLDLDEGLIQQALLNLYLNSLQAVAKHLDPKIEVSLEGSDKDEFIKIIITDNGSGFNPSAIDNVLDPYYTTKAKGTGLGLALVKKIVDSHGGEILLANLKDGGAQVTLVFPFIK